MDSFERFSETQLSEKEKFYSSLSGQGITDEDYAQGKQVWETFGCRNLGDHHNLYVATDSLLLADVFENFRKVCQEKYGLDPGALLQRIRFELGRSLEEDRNRARVAYRHGHAPDDREGKEGRHINGEQTERKGEQPASRKYDPA